MTNLTTLRRQLLVTCYRYHTATTPAQRFCRAAEREQAVREIQRVKGGRG